MNPTTHTALKNAFDSGVPSNPFIGPDDAFANPLAGVWGHWRPNDADAVRRVSGQFWSISAADASIAVPPPDHASPMLVMLSSVSALSGSGTFSTSATPTQVLWLQEAGNAAAISVTDINQGQMGDCYLLSSIGEIAMFHPGYVTQMIRANADGTETVTLYRASNGNLPTFGTSAYTPVAITVSNTFPSNSVNNGASQDVFNGQKEIWVQVLEKAMATLYGGYNGIANGGIPAISMEELTGCSASVTWPSTFSLQQLQNDVAAGDLITFDTGGYGTLPYHMHGSHAYMFQSLAAVNGTVMVNLLNPWGFDQPDPIPFAQLGSVIAQIDIGQFVDHQTIIQGPTLAQQTPDQIWAQGSLVALVLPAGLFNEPGATLTYAVMQANGQACPSWLAFNASTKTFSGTVPAGMATLSLKVTATDTSGRSAFETFKVTVPAAPPTLSHQTAAQTWIEGASLSFVLASNTFADPNGQTLSYAATLSNGLALPAWLTMNSATERFSGTVGYTSGTMSIKVTATDTSGLSAFEVFQVSLIAPPPVVAHQTANQTWTAAQALSFALPPDTFTSVPGQILKYTATLPAGLTINSTTGTISGIVPLALGTNTITVTATETSGLSISETFKATVVALAPVVHQTSAQTWIANKSVSLSLASAFTDPQRESLIYTAALSNGKALPTGLVCNATIGTISGIAPTATGILSITVTAKDQSGLSSFETFQCTVAASAPTANLLPAAQYWAANKVVGFALPPNAFVDPQGEQLTFAATMADGSALPGWLKFNTASGAFSGTAPVTSQTLSLAVTATDQSGLSARETFQALVQAFAPTLGNPTGSLTWAAGKAVSATLAANTFVDPKGEKLTLSATQADGSALPAGLTFNAITGAFGGTAPLIPKTLGLKVTAINAGGLSASETFSATIQAAAPTVMHPTANQIWTDGAPMTFLLPANTFVDPQGAAMTYAAFEISGAAQTNWLRFAADVGKFAGVAPNDLTGTVGIRIVTTDAYGLSASESFGLTFAAAGAHPTAMGAPLATEMLAFHL